jgi:hypothetical protein
MKIITDVIRTAPIVAAIALGLIGIFYLANGKDMAHQPPIVTDAGAQ